MIRGAQCPLFPTTLLRSRVGDQPEEWRRKREAGHPLWTFSLGNVREVPPREQTSADNLTPSIR